MPKSVKRKIYYITRSYHPFQTGGGPHIRTAAVEYLVNLGWEVEVIMPNYNSSEIEVVDNIIQVPFSYGRLIPAILTRLGLFEDYLDMWVKSAYKFLVDRVTASDLVFSTTGGELGSIKLGSLLKEQLGCKFIANYHDPINYTLVHGLKVDNKPHVSREKTEFKYLSNADLIITSSKSNGLSLGGKFPALKARIHNNYFGYISKLAIGKYKKTESEYLRIACTGSMLSNVQKPEILLSIYKGLPKGVKVKLYFIGDTSVNNNIIKLDDNITLIDFLPHDQYVEFMVNNIDVGFVSLANQYYGACVPSKVYEYINLGIPTIGVLPDGDAKVIINDNSFGAVVNTSDVDKLNLEIIKLSEPNKLSDIRKNVLNQRDNWSMEEKSRELDLLLQQV